MMGNATRSWALVSGLGVLAAIPLQSLADRNANDSEFSNFDSIVNTRHNLTQRGGTGNTVDAGLMDSQRNDYGAVCVYCHTPHGASGAINAPLWNHTISTNAPESFYTTYDELGTISLTQNVSAPGPNSLTCLSCHDGTVGIDSVINMPGAGKHQTSQEVGPQDDGFLDTWDGIGGGGGANHVGLNSTGCLVCHISGETPDLFPNAQDFRSFVIGQDLRDDHPVGITFPTSGARAAEFNQPGGIRSGLVFFDLNGNARANTDEVRLYDTGGGPEVECASCHDPHGVPSGGAGSQFLPTFLRVTNDNSALCRTCHNI